MRLWNLTDASDPLLLAGHESYVYDVQVGPDGRRVASAAWDGTTRVWDLATGRPIAALRDPEAGPFYGELGWSPDGTKLASAGADEAMGAGVERGGGGGSLTCYPGWRPGSGRRSS